MSDNVNLVAKNLENEIVEKIDVEEWAAQYEDHIKEPPTEGDLLVTSDGSPIKLEVELKSGQQPFIFGRIYVPNVVGEPVGYFMHSDKISSNYGWKAVLMPKSRDEAIKKLGLKKVLYVKELRVVRLSQTGHSVLCEISEW